MLVLLNFNCSLSSCLNLNRLNSVCLYILLNSYWLRLSFLNYNGLNVLFLLQNYNFLNLHGNYTFLNHFCLLSCSLTDLLHFATFLLLFSLNTCLILNLHLILLNRYLRNNITSRSIRHIYISTRHLSISKPSKRISHSVLYRTSHLFLHGYSLGSTHNTYNISTSLYKIIISLYPVITPFH